MIREKETERLIIVDIKHILKMKEVSNTYSFIFMFNA